MTYMFLDSVIAKCKIYIYIIRFWFNYINNIHNLVYILQINIYVLCLFTFYCSISISHLQ